MKNRARFDEVKNDQQHSINRKDKTKAMDT